MDEPILYHVTVGGLVAVWAVSEEDARLEVTKALQDMGTGETRQSIAYVIADPQDQTVML